MKLIILHSLFFFSLVHAKSYQVGEFWSKKHIRKASQDLQFLKESVGEVGARATLFYIGKNNNKHWAITNNHVCPDQILDGVKKNRCDGQWIQFFYYRNQRGAVLKGKIKQVPLIIKSLDLSLLEISFDNLKDFNRAPRALSFSNHTPTYYQELISIGYGVYNNEYGSLKIEEDSFECRVFSDELRLLNDPDTLNPIPYKVTSFLHGCDVSHGDSGSPILDRYSHEVVGLLWTGKYPKDDQVSQAGFESLPQEFLWKQLNYASPGFLIKKELDKFFGK